MGNHPISEMSFCNSILILYNIMFCTLYSNITETIYILIKEFFNNLWTNKEQIVW